MLGIPNVVDGRVKPFGVNYIDMPRKTTESLRLCIGDLLFVRTNAKRENLGRCAVFKGELLEAIFASYLIRIQVDRDRLLPEFVQLYTMTPQGQSWLSGQASHAADGKFNINSQTIRAVLVPVPPMGEQDQIVQSVKSVQNKVDAGERGGSALEALLLALLARLMTGQVRVVDEVVVK